MMNYFGFGQSADIDIVCDGAESRKLAEVKIKDGKKEKYPLYFDGETVSGKVNVTLRKPGSKFEHHGIKIELIGRIEFYDDRGNHEFTSLVRELARPGVLIQNTSYPFEFANVEKPFEVYVGSSVRLRYFLRVTIERRSDIVREVDIMVHRQRSDPEINSPIEIHRKFEDYLLIKLVINKNEYHLKDVIVGTVCVLLNRFDVKEMKMSIIKREDNGTGQKLVSNEKTVAEYKIMEGAPVVGESIPIRMSLADYDLTPTMQIYHQKKLISVLHFLKFSVIDTDGLSYYSEKQISLWRKADEGLTSALTSSSNLDVPRCDDVTSVEMKTCIKRLVRKLLFPASVK